MRLEWKLLAVEDRERIVNYVAEHNPIAAFELDEEIEAKVEQLIQRPELYRVGRKRGTREMVVRPNYLVIYRLRGEVAEILRVKHAAEQWPLAR